MKSKHLKLVLFLILVILVMILNHSFGWSGYLKDIRNLAFLQNLVKENVGLAAVGYIVLTVIGCVVLALPGVTFAMFAGIFFHPVVGTILCSVATTIGAALSFLVGRFFLKDSLKPWIQKNRYLSKVLFDESGKNEILLLMITRLVPLFPYNLQNFAYGITDIGFIPYTLYSFLFMLPGTALFTIGTAGIVDASNRTLYIGVAVVLALLVFGCGYGLKKKYVEGGKGSEKGE